MDQKYKHLVRLIKTSVDPVTVFDSLGIKTTMENSVEIRSSCPFHNGKNPSSFRFDKRSGYWSCFSQYCHEGANDLFGLVMKRLNLSFNEAFHYLADLAGIDVGKSESDEDLRKLIDEAKILSFCNSRLNKANKEMRVYDEAILERLKTRDSSYFFIREGFSDFVLDYFELGGTFVDSSGVIRSAIPIRNEDGDLVMITGRRVDSDKDPRYKPTDYGVPKGSVLYNYNNAKHFIENFDGRLFVVEGFKGCWRMVENGLFNTVACMGAKVTDEQVKLIQGNTLIREVILMLDGDAAGIKGTSSSMRNLITGCSVKALYLPKGTDPSMYDKDTLFNIFEQKKYSYFNKLITSLLV